MPETYKQSITPLRTHKEQQPQEQHELKERMSKIKHKIAIISGKGGVGKSTITVNIATAFAMQNKQVGILDADIHGPSVPKLLGLEGRQIKISPNGAEPVEGPWGLKVMSIDFFLTPEAPVIWRGPLKMRAIKQFLSEVIWNELDYLFIDLPPGTGDEPLSIAQLLPELDGVIIITMPTQLASSIVNKAITFAEKLNMPVIGVVENMSGFICPHCNKKTEIFGSGGGEKLSNKAGVAFLGSIPIDPQIRVDSDSGRPFVYSNKESATTKAFKEIIAKVQKFTENKKIM
ncbi:MAG: Mrp/NBP35 family ATP-binding protein [Nitrososphaerota archaeon]|jgi:ATP-binding protein involved in chromosome partitioning|nr:Mrp/NBP35 family ATP-binding protein [Nitrososphaerota archaeon]